MLVAITDVKRVQKLEKISEAMKGRKFTLEHRKILVYLWRIISTEAIKKLGKPKII